MPELSVRKCANFVIIEIPESGEGEGTAEGLVQELMRLRRQPMASHPGQFLGSSPVGPHLDKLITRFLEALPERPKQS